MPAAPLKRYYFSHAPMNDRTIYGWYTRLICSERCKHLAVIGGGGKSSMLCSIAAAFKQSRRAALFATTTKMQPCEIYATAAPAFISQVNNYRELLDAVDKQQEQPLFCHRGICCDKVFGIEPQWLTRLALDRPDLPVIYEGDGSRGLPLKRHATGEPVLSESCAVVYLAGLSALGCNARNVLHRFTPNGANDGFITADYLAELATTALDQLTVSGQKTVFLNQSELITTYERSLLRAAHWKHAVFLGSMRQDCYIQIH